MASIYSTPTNTSSITTSGNRISYYNAGLISLTKSVVNELRVLDVPDVNQDVKTVIQNGDVLAWNSTLKQFVNFHFDTATTISYPYVSDIFVSSGGADTNAGNTTPQAFLTFEHAIMMANQRIVQVEYDFWIQGTVNFNASLITKLNKVPYCKIRGINQNIIVPLGITDPPRAIGVQLVPDITTFNTTNFTSVPTYTIATAGTWSSTLPIASNFHYIKGNVTNYYQPFVNDPYITTRIHLATATAALPSTVQVWTPYSFAGTLNIISAASFVEFQGLVVINDLEITTNTSMYFNGTGEIVRALISSSVPAQQKIRFFGGEGYAEQVIFNNMFVSAEARTRFNTCVFINCTINNNAYTEFTGCTFFNCISHTITQGYSVISQSNWMFLNLSSSALIVNQSGALSVTNSIITARTTAATSSTQPFISMVADAFAEITNIKILELLNTTNFASVVHAVKSTLTLTNIEVLADTCTLPVVLLEESVLRFKSFSNASTGLCSLLSATSSTIIFDTFVLTNCLLNPATEALIVATRCKLFSDAAFTLAVDPSVTVVGGIIFLDGSDFIANNNNPFNISNNEGALLLSLSEARMNVALGLDLALQKTWVGKIVCSDSHLSVYLFTTTTVKAQMPSLHYSTVGADYHFEIYDASQVFITSMNIGVPFTFSKLALVDRSSNLSIISSYIDISGIANQSALVINDNSSAFLADCNMTVASSANVPIIDVSNFGRIGLAQLNTAANTAINGNNCSSIIRAQYGSNIGIRNYNLITSGSNVITAAANSYLTLENTSLTNGTITVGGISAPIINMTTNSDGNIDTCKFNFTNSGTTILSASNLAYISAKNLTKTGVTNASTGVVATKQGKIDLASSPSIIDNVLTGTISTTFAVLANGIAPPDITVAGVWLNSQGASISYT